MLQHLTDVTGSQYRKIDLHQRAKDLRFTGSPSRGVCVEEPHLQSASHFQAQIIFPLRWVCGNVLDSKNGTT